MKIVSSFKALMSLIDEIDNRDNGRQFLLACRSTVMEGYLKYLPYFCHITFRCPMTSKADLFTPSMAIFIEYFFASFGDR